MVDYVAWLTAGLKKPRKTQRGLAKAIGIEESAVSRVLSGERRLQAAEIQPAATYLEEKPPTVNPLVKDSSYIAAGEGAESPEQQQVEMDALTRLAIRQAVDRYGFKSVFREADEADEELRSQRARP